MFKIRFSMAEQIDKNLIKFGRFIRQLRKKAKLSQDDVAKNSNKLTKATVSDIENGKRNLAFTTFLDLAKGLGKAPKELVDMDFELDKED